jgi:flagellar biosynthesis/type III secretory pathway protein FliH
VSRIVRAGPKVIPVEVLDARARAEAIVAVAHAEAERLVAEARLEAERTRESTRTAAEEAGRAEVAALLVRAHAIVDAAREDAEADLKRLAVAAAERLVHAELALHPERIRDVVRGVLDRAKRATRLVVMVSPEDRALLEGMPELASARIEEDPSLARGDCVARTDLGTLDGRLVVRLDALRRALLA